MMPSLSCIAVLAQVAISPLRPDHAQERPCFARDAKGSQSDPARRSVPGQETQSEKRKAEVGHRNTGPEQKHADLWAQLAALAAVAAAFIATVQATLMRQTIIASNDSFVFVEGMDVSFETPAKRRIVIRPRWRNSGNAPTRNACFYSNQKISDDRSAPSEAEFHAPDEGVFELGFIGPKGHRDGPGVAFAAEDIDAQQRGLKRLFWWAWTEYESVFWMQGRRRTEVLYELVVFGDFRNDSHATYFNSPLGMHNCADGECPAVPRKSGGKYRRKHHDQAAALARHMASRRQAYPRG